MCGLVRSQWFLDPSCLILSCRVVGRHREGGRRPQRERKDEDETEDDPRDGKRHYNH